MELGAADPFSRTLLVKEERMIHTASAFRPCACGAIHIPDRRELDRLGIPEAARLHKDIKAMFIANSMKDLMLAAIATASATNPDFGSLHTAYSTTGANEVTGGSPAYARVALTWSAPASGETHLVATLPSWNVPTGTTVGWWGGWDAVTGGNFRFMQGLGAQTLKPAMVEVAADLTNNDIFCDAHGYTADQRVIFWSASGIGLTTGLTTGTIYYVLATGLATDSFRVSTTSGGSAVDLTTDAPNAFFVQRVIPQTTVTQDVISLASASIDIGALGL